FEKEGLTVEKYLEAAYKRPQLFYQSPDTIESNIRNLVKKFEKEGLTVEKYLKVAYKQPQLFYQSPDTIESNIRNLVKKFENEGLTVEKYLKAACDQPSLFCQSPETIAQHIHFVQELEKRGVIKTPVKYGSALEWLLKNPKYMTYGNDNYMLRFYYAKLLDKPATLENLTKSKKKVISELDKRFNILKVENGEVLIDLDKLESLYEQKYKETPAKGAHYSYLWEKYR
ncbi:MAG: hypothetical protein QXO65_00770, partial [Candidatus Aenigmatarchaeota archaeon]